jgi:hypothetical protein
MQVCEPCKDNYDPNHKQEIHKIPREIQRDWNKTAGELKKQRNNKLKSIDREWRQANK